jgi:dephospho-CoA kinase
MVHLAYKDPSVKHTLHQWWGDMVFDPRGEIDRPAVARKIFASSSERSRLERLIHPIVNQIREKMMKAAAHDPAIKAYIFDTPLLFETELNRHCDAVVFVDTPREVRLKRVRNRGWEEAELDRRENSQMPLDSKAKISDYRVANPAEANPAKIEPGTGNNPAENADLRDQVRNVLSQILDSKG